MKREFDIAALLAPISDEQPSGEDLRYTTVYDEIKEARRADDPFDRGEWNRELKTADWEKVFQLSLDALTQKTKDLQIAAWLTEALIHTEGFGGLATGLQLLHGLLKDFWDSVYPLMEEGDLEFRVAPLEFINDKLWPAVKAIPLTDVGVAQGYGWLKWQESRSTGYEKDTRNQYGDVDENKKRARDEFIAEGKLSAEDFDAALALSSTSFYGAVIGEINECMALFDQLDQRVDEKYGKDAPRLSELKQAIEDCQILVNRISKQKGGADLVAQEAPKEATPVKGEIDQRSTGEEPSPGALAQATTRPEDGSTGAGPLLNGPRLSEPSLWEWAFENLSKFGLKSTLDLLLKASCGAPSTRERNNHRLTMAKVCLKAGRPDLAKPIVEDLYALIEELHLERWESSVWIAEVIDALYQCLAREGSADDDQKRAEELLRKLCTMDVTKAMVYRQ
jgi:type VI secretion system protein ImpA